MQIARPIPSAAPFRHRLPEKRRHSFPTTVRGFAAWIPACAGMTGFSILGKQVGSGGYSHLGRGTCRGDSVLPAVQQVVENLHLAAEALDLGGDFDGLPNALFDAQTGSQGVYLPFQVRQLE